MINHNRCPVCNERDIREEVRSTDHLVSGESFQIARCNNCRLLFTQEVPGENDIGSYYKSEDYVSHSDISSGLLYWLYHLGRQIMLKRKHKMITKASGLKEGSLLDIGSGTGYFPAYMKRKKWISTAVEIDEEAREFSRNKFNLEVHGLDELEKFKPGQFDVITLWHVMEHLDNPVKMLTKIYDLLKYNGNCIIAVPNNQSYDAKLFGESWAAWDVPRHRWHFDIPSFRYLVNLSGFRIRQIRRLPLDSFYISVLSARYRNYRMAFIFGLIVGFISLVCSIINRKYSSSLVYILDKKV